MFTSLIHRCTASTGWLRRLATDVRLGGMGDSSLGLAVISSSFLLKLSTSARVNTSSKKFWLAGAASELFGSRRASIACRSVVTTTRSRQLDSSKLLFETDIC